MRVKSHMGATYVIVQLCCSHGLYKTCIPDTKQGNISNIINTKKIIGKLRKNQHNVHTMTELRSHLALEIVVLHQDTLVRAHCHQKNQVIR